MMELLWALVVMLAVAVLFGAFQMIRCALLKRDVAVLWIIACYIALLGLSIDILVIMHC